MHNLNMRWIFALIFMFIIPALATSDFEIEKRRLERRYQDFYQRIQEKQRKTVIRQDWVKAHKKRREQFTKKYDAKRRSFVKRGRERKRDRGEAQYEALLEKREAVHHKVRLEYIKQRERLRKIKEGSAMIPPDQDVGLEEI